MNDLSEIKTLKDYIHLFGNNLEHKVCGEKCGNYLFSDNAYLNIWNYNKDAKIIVILRNPVDRAYSHYLHSKRDEHETLPFQEALSTGESLKELVVGHELLGAEAAKFFDSDVIANIKSTHGSGSVKQLEDQLSLFEENIAMNKRNL